MTIKKNSYFRVEAFMVSELNLKGNHLIAYAIIHSFSKDNGWYTGGHSYLNEWLHVSKQTLVTILKSLSNEGLIVAEHTNEKGKTRIKYKTTYSRPKNSSSKVKKLDLPKVKKLDHDGQKIRPSRSKNLTLKVKNLDPYNKIYINNKYIHNSYGRTETCFFILKSITVNTNQLNDPETKCAFLDATLELQDEEHLQSADEIVFVWNSIQTELKGQGREAKFMPNVYKWLTTEAVAKVKQSRKGRHYSVSRATKTVDRLAEKLGMVE